MLRKSDRQDNLRTRVTRRLLWEALFSLIEERNFSEITIQDICTRADVNRSTFYHHFDNKYDLLDYGISTVIPEQAGLSGRAPKEGQRWSDQGPHVALFTYVKNHQKFWSNLIAKEGFSEAILAGMLDGTKVFMKELYSDTYEDETQCEIAAQMYIGAVGNLTIWWLRNNCEMSISELNDYVDSLWRYPKKRRKKPNQTGQ